MNCFTKSVHNCLGIFKRSGSPPHSEQPKTKLPQSPNVKSRNKQNDEDSNACASCCSLVKRKPLINETSPITQKNAIVKQPNLNRKCESYENIRDVKYNEKSVMSYDTFPPNNKEDIVFKKSDNITDIVENRLMCDNKNESISSKDIQISLKHNTNNSCLSSSEDDIIKTDTEVYLQNNNKAECFNESEINVGKKSSVEEMGHVKQLIVNTQKISDMTETSENPSEQEDNKSKSNVDSNLQQSFINEPSQSSKGKSTCQF